MEAKNLIRSLIDTLSADKQMAQPWKNYCISDARRLEALIEKALVTTNAKAPEPAPAEPVAADFDVPPTRLGTCICKPGTKADAACPVHGLTL